MKCYMSQPPPSPSIPSPPAASPPLWDIVITEWALNSYLDLKRLNTFTDQEYWNTIRPDVELLRGGIPNSDPKFGNSTFWGPAKQGNVVLPDGYKMKWRQLGPGQVQLRLPIYARSRQVFLCEAYVKQNAKYEQRRLARFKTHLNLIFQGNYQYRGKL